MALGFYWLFGRTDFPSFDYNSFIRLAPICFALYCEYLIDVRPLAWYKFHQRHQKLCDEKLHIVLCGCDLLSGTHEVQEALVLTILIPNFRDACAG